jgi:hypothetical protein
MDAPPPQMKSMRFNSRSRLNLALMAAVVALASLTYFRPGTKAPAPVVQLMQLKAAQVGKIRISLPGQKTVELTRSDRGWQMEAPLGMPADPNLVQTLLNTLDLTSEKHFPAAGAALAQYGLDKPKAELWLNGAEYAFGGLQPVDNLQYVLADGQIHLVNAILFYRIAHDPYWWVDKGLLPAGSHITALQLPQATFTLDKRGAWQLAPADASVSADDIQRLMDAWQGELAISVGPIGKDAHEGEVSVSIAGSDKPLRFAILKDPDFLVLARPDLGLQYELDTSLRDTLLSPGHKTAAAH